MGYSKCGGKRIKLICSHNEGSHVFSMAQTHFFNIMFYVVLMRNDVRDHNTVLL